MKKLAKGTKLNPMTLTDINGSRVAIPDEKQVIHLQFRRFSGCPICNVHMGRLASRQQELIDNNIKEVIVFYSEDKKIRENLADIPFTMIGDPQKKLYQAFGVEKSLMSVINPLAWPAATLGFIKNIAHVWRLLPSGDESMLGLPADFLLAQDGTLLDVHYGSHAYDQWDVETLIGKVNLHYGLTSQQPSV